MSRDLRVAALLATVAAAAAALTVAAALLIGGWPAELRPQLAQWAAQRGALLAIALLAALGAAAAAGWALLAPRLGFVPRLAHDLELLRSSRPDLRVDPRTGVPAPLAGAINALADAHEARRRSSEAEIELATQRLAEERDLLAAVLADLPAAVVACSRDGRVLLYTPRAAELVQRVAPDTFLGLGRTVFALFRRSAIVHGLERMELAIARGDARAVAAALLTTRGGALLHARFTPLSGRSLSGFFLHLQPVVEGLATGAVVEDSRRQVANLRAAAEMLRDFPAMTDAERARFVAIVAEESQRLAQALDAHAPASGERWPLEDIAADTLLPLLQSALQPAVAQPVQLPATLPQLWVAAESFSLAALLRDFCTRIGGADTRFTLALSAHDGHAQLELRWQPPRLLEAERWRVWEQTPLSEAGGGLPLTPAAVVQGHGGELWQQLDRDAAVLRVLLQKAETPAPQRAGGIPAQVEYAAAPATARDGEQPLAALIYTAFDTETTGLDPSGGDEIIAIGGIRVVGGRILSSEVFETLVATGRRIDPAAQRVHGIDASMLGGQPSATEALQRFRSFCEDTVLLGHNTAFDLRFFELQGAAAGTRFDLPVLDTLLLSQLVYPQPDAHQLEAIAERLGLSVVGRHTALGDAILAAEVFLRLLPLLAARGIHTLTRALDASRQTALARLRY